MFTPLLEFNPDTTMEGAVETIIEKEQALPYEIIVSILDILLADEAMKTLANVVSVNKMMYGLFHSKLYRTIRVTDTNQDKLLFGCTGTSAFNIKTLMSRST